MFYGVFKSKIFNKKILLIQPGVGLSTQNFTGLDFETTTKHAEVFNDDDISLLKDTEYDYIFVHGFLLRELNRHYTLKVIQAVNIKCNELIIDYSGEGYSLLHDIKNYIRKNSKVFNYNKIKIISPLDNIDILKTTYPDIDFFDKTKVPGLRFFCSPFNHMLHDSNSNHQNYTKVKGKYVYSGLNWSDSKKEYLFMCLNNRQHIHRALLVNEILKEGLEKDILLSCNFGENFNENLYFWNESKNDVVKGVDINLKKITIDGDNLFGIFSPNIHLAKKAYIDIVTETNPAELMFITEKTAKPFFNLQFPIIFGPPGIIKKLKEYGFDIFDDIINHDYDDLEMNFDESSNNYNERLNEFLYTKTKLIIKELKRLSTLDFHQIYLQSKDRLLFNQKLINEICIDNNDIITDMGDFIFGDSIIYCQDLTFDRHTY